MDGCAGVSIYENLITACPLRKISTGNARCSPCHGQGPFSESESQLQFIFCTSSQQSLALCCRAPLQSNSTLYELAVLSAGDPLVTPDALVVKDWGRFQSPGAGWEECPYGRSIAFGSLLQMEDTASNKTENPMIVGIIDQSLANWCAFPLLAHYLSSCSLATNQEDQPNNTELPECGSAHGHPPRQAFVEHPEGAAPLCWPPSVAMALPDLP